MHLDDFRNMIKKYYIIKSFLIILMPLMNIQFLILRARIQHS